MKVLFIAKTLTKGGAASGARNLIFALRAAGAKVIVLDGNEHIRGKLIKFIRIAERIYERLFYNAETHCLRLGPATFDLKKLYNEYLPDVIQICDVSANTISFLDVSKVPCPVVHRMSDFWPYHGAKHYADTSPICPSSADYLLRYLIFDGSTIPDCQVAPSYWLANCLKIKGGERKVIRNATSIPDNIPPKKRYPGVVRFGFISGQVLDPRKGFTSLPLFLESLAEKIGQKIELHIFGKLPNNYYPKIVNVDVVLYSAFSADEIDEVYKMFDILLCPSRLDNSPNVVSEALARGVPVIGQTGTGIDSYLEIGTGALINFHNAEKSNLVNFFKKTNLILGKYEEYSKNAADFARSKLSPLSIGNEYLKLYDRLIRDVSKK